MYANAGAARVVPTTTKVETYDVEEGNVRIPNIPQVPYLDVVSALNDTGDTLILFCVNRRLSGVTSARISVDGFNGPGKAQSLFAAGIAAANNEERPEAVTPVESAVQAEDSTLEYTFPPASVTVIKLKKDG
ncbi:MAG TPA: alpha-L-arabinofuranosidase C-terminal domain-containing protein, partial [Armatimonadota bacterium]|nr:alpha-L-arabinofuranosidase C-terminal domain-containing protein [Armatimonadota bacterium]